MKTNVRKLHLTRTTWPPAHEPVPATPNFAVLCDTLRGRYGVFPGGLGLWLSEGDAYSGRRTAVMLNDVVLNQHDLTVSRVREACARKHGWSFSARDVAAAIDLVARDVHFVGETGVPQRGSGWTLPCGIDIRRGQRMSRDCYTEDLMSATCPVCHSAVVEAPPARRARP